MKANEIPLTRNCKRCGSSFVNRYRQVRFCSPKCWYASRDEEKIKRHCEGCGKEMLLVRHSKLRACSVKCGGLLRRTKKPFKCFQCGKEFFKYQSARTRKFCGWKCAVEYSREQIPVRCTRCGKTFTRGRALVKRSKQIFCGRECWRKFYRGAKHPLFRGGTAHFRGTDWSLQARKARKRDMNVCRVCGTPKQKGEALSVDHIIPYRMFQCNDLRNLLSICRAPCHAIKTSGIEPKILAGDKLGFLQGLRTNGWPMDAVEAALALFESNPQLPLHANRAGHHG